MATATESSLDVDWLLPSKKDLANSVGDRNNRNKIPQTSLPPQVSQPEPLPAQPRLEQSILQESQNGATAPLVQQSKPTITVNGKENNVQPSTTKPAPQQTQSHPVRQTTLKGQGVEDGRKASRIGTPPKKEGRRSSWISSISSKFSSTPSPSRNGTGEISSANTSLTASPQPSPQVEVTNPFEKHKSAKDGQKETKKDEVKSVVTPVAPRRPSVLVAAGKETKLDHPGFLSSALRRLSSSSNATMGKGGNSGAVCPRRVMNVDHNRERIKIGEFDQNKLKRVAFCVDVEIAGFASQADEDPEHGNRPPVSSAQKQNLSATPEKEASSQSKDARMKEKGEGAALKNPKAMAEQKEMVEPPLASSTSADSAESEEAQGTQAAEASESLQGPDPPAPGSRKKEKKKRSEAERKERKERKRRHAEANGIVPLELTRDDDDSDSFYSSTPPGATTPRRSGDSGDGRTTDPLRIYKRCCQLRETTVLPRIKEQISKPTATLADAPGTVAVMDLSGFPMQLQDIVTLGDWLAVVPVRKLVLDNCGLTDEGVRVILSGLSGCKSAEQARQNRKLPRRSGMNHAKEQMGVIEKLSLKGNTAITNLGWRHIALFMHMSHSLRAIDLSGLPFPKSTDLSRTSTTSSNSSAYVGNSTLMDLGSLVIHAISERLGEKLEELIFSGCGLSPANIRDLVDCTIKCKIRRLGLAASNLNEEALSHLVRYIKEGQCEGLDLGSNDLHGIAHHLADAAASDSPLFAISLSDCDLTTDDLSSLLIPFARLRNLKFIDLSRNMALFNSTPNAVPVLRKLLPKLLPLKRLHLSDVGMTSEQVIAIAEILPDCPSLCHLSILDNAPLVHAMNSKEDGSQEEACAFFASLMTAVRVSETIIAVEIEVPSADSSEVVKAVASQVVAYSLRNMERTTMNEVDEKPDEFAGKETPEVLLHLVGHMEAYPATYDRDEPAPDEDYMIASTGIVKALGVCLDRKDANSRGQSRNISPANSGTSTPRGPMRQRPSSKPRNVSLELCGSARKIRQRLQPVLVREDQAGNDEKYRRLFFLDQTLQRMIQRFEDEYPETKVPFMSSSPPPPNPNGMPSPDPSVDASVLSTSVDSNSAMPKMYQEESFASDRENEESLALKLSRHPSGTSVAAKAFTNEEGRMHRFGQSMRREILKPTGIEDNLHGSTATSVDPPHLAVIRNKLEELKGEDIRERVEREGADLVLREIGLNAQELLMLREQDPEGFEAFKESQMVAQINAGLI